MGVRGQCGDLVPGGDHPAEKLLQHGAALHPSASTDVELRVTLRRLWNKKTENCVPEAGRIRTGDVDHQGIGVWPECVHASHEVVDGFRWRRLVFA